MRGGVSSRLELKIVTDLSAMTPETAVYKLEGPSFAYTVHIHMQFPTMR